MYAGPDVSNGLFQQMFWAAHRQLVHTIMETRLDES